MNFITLDFETATSARDSPCEVGLTFVKDGQIEKTMSWLVKPIQYPHFESFNIGIHGIRPKDVEDKPEFDQVWEVELKSLLNNQFVIAHNAGFDISVLRKTLQAYNISFPALEYSCSYIFSKKVWTGLLSYDLKSLCYHNKIELKHHRAGPDSLACAELSLRAFDLAGIRSTEDFPDKLRTSIGRLYDGGYKPSETKRIYQGKNPSSIIGDPAKHKPESIFYGSNVVFTGKLSSMGRADAQRIIADIGGTNLSDVTQETDFLVVGQQDYRFVGEDGMSNKQEKAQRLLAKGYNIEVISEADFLRNIE